MSETKREGVRGYKVFNPNWMCRDFQYEVGKTYTEDVDPQCCGRGFHFCTKLLDCFQYYPFISNYKVAEVEALGDIAFDEEDSMCCTNKIHIIRELTWEEVLDLINTGEHNTGFSNSGNSNKGNWNSGNGNTGDCNSGDGNSGNWNTGNWNSGKWNTGSCNSGHYNSGNYNSGSSNSGHRNTGNRNTGNDNIGSRNSGDWNKTSYSNGCFNTDLPKIFLFNQPSDWTYQDWLHSDARSILSRCPKTLTWTNDEDMTENEKEIHPEYSMTGEFLKQTKELKAIRQEWWNSLPVEEKAMVKAIPNFDADIFYECTGIKVN